MQVQAGGQPMKYPYTLSAKLAQFPYKFHWKQGRFVRYLSYTLIITFPLIWKIHRMANNPENVRNWDAIRKRRDHTYFEPVHE